MLRTLGRAFTTWTRQGWLDGAAVLHGKLDDLEVRLGTGQLKKPAFDVVFDEVNKNFRNLHGARFSGPPLQYHKEMVEELSVRVKRIRMESDKIFWDAAKKM